MPPFSVRAAARADQLRPPLARPCSAPERPPAYAPHPPLLPCHQPPFPSPPKKPQGVVGYVLSGPDGQVVASTLAPNLADAYSSAMPALGRAAKAAVRDLDPRDDLCFMRLRAARHEIAVASS
jgi:dynein light chain roadblock-type